MFNSYFNVILVSSERMAPRFLENHAKVNYAIEASSKEMSLVPVLMVIALAVIGIIMFINSTQNSRKDELIASKERKLEERTARAEDRYAKATEELINARHMLAIMRAGVYVPTDEVPGETPAPDSVFGAKDVEAASKPISDTPRQGTPAEAFDSVEVDGSVDAENPSEDGYQEPSVSDVTDADVEAILGHEVEKEMKSNKK